MSCRTMRCFWLRFVYVLLSRWQEQASQAPPVQSFLRGDGNAEEHGREEAAASAPVPVQLGHPAGCGGLKAAFIPSCCSVLRSAGIFL